jgi:uncharacterized repeat protein (TIGR01451 family)
MRQDIMKKILSKLKRLSTKGLLVAASVAAIAGIGIAHVATAQADVTFPASTADCDANAVVRCGVTSTAAIKSHFASDASVQHIYAGFGIDSSDINAIGTTAVAGYVTDGNLVYINGNTNPIATAAVTAGRENIGTGTKVVIDGTTFYKRAPSESFKSKSIPAFVVMKDGVFQYAIISTCANPVNATAKKPNYAIAKTVSTDGVHFNESATVAPNTKVTYSVVVKSTGDIAADNILAKDVLPANVTYVDNSLTRDGVKVNTDSIFFTTGIRIQSLPAGDKVLFRFEAIVGAKDTLESCNDAALTNTANIAAPGLPTMNDTAVVNEKCLPKPVATCDSLNAGIVAGDNNYAFSTLATAKNGATITGYSYNYGDGTTELVTGTLSLASHVYKPGTYTASVTVNYTVNGVAKTATSPACTAHVTIPQPATPVYTCDNLTATQNSRTAYSFAAASTATNGATLVGYTYNFGDGAVTPGLNSPATAQHTYTNPGTYNVSVVANFTVNGVAKTAASTACQTTVTVAPQPFAECTGLTATFGDNRTATATATYTAQNGATLTGVSFDFGDSSAVVNGTATTASHTYAADGTYTVKATLTFSGGATASSICQAIVSFNTPQPTYTCDAFTITKGDDHNVTVATLQTTGTNGAVFKSVDINWGDNVSSNGVTTAVGQTHKYADGTFVITAVAHFTVNGQDVIAGGEHCTQTVSYTTTPPPVTPPVVTPPTPAPVVVRPAALVNTGAGSVVSLFALATIGGTIAYRWMLGRKLDQNS